MFQEVIGHQVEVVLILLSAVVLLLLLFGSSSVEEHQTFTMLRLFGSCYHVSSGKCFYDGVLERFALALFLILLSFL